jgi:hypothetical protein
MVAAEAVREESDPRLAAWTIARMLHAELSSVSRILGVAQLGGQERQNEQQRDARGSDLHSGLLG